LEKAATTPTTPGAQGPENPKNLKPETKNRSRLRDRFLVSGCATVTGFWFQDFFGFSGP
jgi:hypothetical protein